MAKPSFKKNTAELFISSANEQREAPQPAKEDFIIPKGYKLVKESKSERMQLLVRPLVKKALKETAAAQGVSTNDLINTIFEEYLEERGII